MNGERSDLLETLTPIELQRLLVKNNFGIFAKEIDRLKVGGARARAWTETGRVALKSGSPFQRRQLLRFFDDFIDRDRTSRALFRVEENVRAAAEDDDKHREEPQISIRREASKFRTEISCFVLIFLSVGWIYRRILTETCEFVNFDDDENFVNNDPIHFLNRESLRWMLVEGQVLGVYEPVANIFKALVGHAFLCTRSFDGDAIDHATVMIRTSVVLHIINSFLSVIFCAELLELSRSRRKKPSFDLAAYRTRWWSSTIAVLTLAVHPLRVESVAWASGQPYLLSTFFCILSCAAHVRYRRESDSALFAKIGCRFCSLLFLVFGALSKAPAIALPVAFVCFDWWYESRTSSNREHALRRISRMAINHVPTLATSLFALYLAYGPAQTQGMRTRSMSSLERVTRALYAPICYMQMTLAPKDLSVLYPIPSTPMMPWSAQFALPVSCTIALTVTAVAILLRRRTSDAALIASLGWIAYFGCLSPTLGLVSKHVWGLVADRYCHIPFTIVVAPLLAAGIFVVLSKTGLANSRPSLPISRVAIGCTLLMGWLAWLLWLASASEQLAGHVWSDSEALWRYTVTVQPHNAFARNNLASTLGLEISKLNGAARDARLEEALQHYEDALRREPMYPEALLNAASLMGTPYYSDAKHRRALSYIDRVISNTPRHARALFTRALVHHAKVSYLIRESRKASGEDRWQDFLTAAENAYRAALAEAVEQNGEASAAVAKIRINFGVLLGDEDVRRFEEASALLRSAMPRTAERSLFRYARLQLAHVLQHWGKWPEAIETYERVVRDEPQKVDAVMNLAGLLGDTGRVSEAAWYYRSVLSVDPNNAGALCGVGGALATEGRLKEALEYWERGVRADPSFLRIVGANMALVYDQLGMALKSREIRASLSEAGDL